jgi:hypothetical protein
MSSGLRVLAARLCLLIQSLRGCATMAPIARGLAVTGSRWAKLAGVVALAAAAALGCGGGGSSTGSTDGAGTPPGPSYSFAADSGVRVPGGVQPVELVVGTTTYMFLSGYVAPNGKVLSSTDGLTFTPIAVTLDGGPLVGTSFSFVSRPSGGFACTTG